MNDRPVAELLPPLLEERGYSFRRLASSVGVTHTYLVRIVNDPRKRPTGQLAARIAEALGLPHDYFPETREASVIDAVRHDGRLRDELYRGLSTRT